MWFKIQDIKIMNNSNAVTAIERVGLREKLTGVEMSSAVVFSLQ